MKKKFCEYCRDLVDFKVIEIVKVDTIKDVKIRYKEKRAICSKCGNWFIPSHIMDQNLERRSTAYYESKK